MRKYVLSFIVLGVIAVLIYVVAVPRAVTVETTTVTRGVFVETIKADGILRSKERFVVPAFADGDIKRVDFKVGDSVKKGQTITQLFWDARDVPVKSPINGVISKIFRDNAGPIHRGEPIVEIIDPSALEVMAELLTTDAAQVRSGMPLNVEGWGGALPIEAVVVRVSKAGFTKQSALGVDEEKTEIVADPKNIPSSVLERIGSNFHVDVLIQLSRRENILKIPVGAIFRDGPKWAVYLVRDGHTRKVPVEIAARSNEEVAITKGLSEGDVVVVYPGDLVKEGSRVRN